MGNKKVQLLLAAILLFLPSIARAQATPTSKVGWDQPAPDLATAQAYTYKHYDDGSTTGTNYTSVTCVGTASPFQCQTPITAYSQGNHSLTLTATNIAGESVKSNPLGFVFVNAPANPINPKIIP